MPDPVLRNLHSVAMGIDVSGVFERQLLAGAKRQPFWFASSNSTTAK